MRARFHIERENAGEAELRIAKRCASTKQGFVRLQAIEELYRGRSPKVVTLLHDAALFLGQRSLPLQGLERSSDQLRPICEHPIKYANNLCCQIVS